jgi:hypothetical protein
MSESQKPMPKWLKFVLVWGATVFALGAIGGIFGNPYGGALGAVLGIYLGVHAISSS